MLKMSQINSIRDLSKSGYRIADIAKKLGIDRKTVRKYLEEDDFSPQPPVQAAQPSKLDPYKPMIRQWLHKDQYHWHKQHHTAKRIFDELKEKTDFDGSYSIVQRYVKSIRHETIQKASQELVWEPGSAQVDFGEAEFVVQGKPCRRKYLVVSFPYSNDGFAQVFGGETAECVKYIGGVPRLLVFDNATGVGRRIGDRIHETELFRTAGEKYPETNFYTILPYHYGGNIRTYFVRIYQLRYLQGMLAGLKTQTGRIGFISYDRLPDNVQELDAFALGVRRTNPHARVLATFQPGLTAPDADAIAATERMIREAHVDVMAAHRSNDAVPAYAIAHGVYTLANYGDLPDSPLLLARQNVDWQLTWAELLKDDVRKSNPQAFYWFDYNEADMSFTVVSPDVTADERALIAQAEEELRQGFEPFSGDIRDNEGVVRCRAGEYISDETLRESIDWLVEGVSVYE